LTPAIQSMLTASGGTNDVTTLKENIVSKIQVELQQAENISERPAENFRNRRAVLWIVADAGLFRGAVIGTAILTCGLSTVGWLIRLVIGTYAIGFSAMGWRRRHRRWRRHKRRHGRRQRWQRVWENHIGPFGDEFWMGNALSPKVKSCSCQINAIQIHTDKQSQRFENCNHIGRAIDKTFCALSNDVVTFGCLHCLNKDSASITTNAYTFITTNAYMFTCMHWL